jgi:hypothetical protein
MHGLALLGGPRDVVASTPSLAPEGLDHKDRIGGRERKRGVRKRGVRKRGVLGVFM